MGGGIGVPPILELARQLNCEKKIIVGYRDENCFLQSDFEKTGRSILQRRTAVWAPGEM